MKRNALQILLFCILLSSITFAQQPQNFYSIKAKFDSYYDSLIQIYGIDNLQGTGFNPYKRWVDFWEPILYPTGDFSIERQNLENYVSEFLSVNSSLSIAPFTLDWTLIGPDKMPDGEDEAYKGLGQVHYLAFDPNDTTNQKMFACSPAGGLWRSLNGGNTWFNAGTDKGLPLSGISSIAIDPENSDTHWFVSTGNGEPMPGGFWAQNAIGVGRTIDGGATWEIIGLEDEWQMRKVILTRHQGQVHLFVATTGGVFECEDALSSNPQFIELIDGNFYDVECDPLNTGIIYASGTGSNTSVYKIDYINNLYTELSNISLIPVENGRRLIIEVSPAAPQYLFIVATYDVDDGGLNTSYLFRYNLNTNILINKGELPVQAWSQPGVGPERAMGWALSHDLFNNELLMVHGNTAPIRISNNLLDDNVCLWTDVTSGYSNSEIHVDMHYMAFESDDQTLWVGNDGGVYKSSMPDLINNWEEKNDGLAIATIHHLAVNENNSDVALSGAYDCGSNFYTKSNNQWDEIHVIAGDGFQCHFDWNNPDKMWASPQFKIYRSDNGGQNFIYKGASFHWHTFFIQNHVYPNILYGTNETGIRRSTDYGDSWNNYASYPGVSNNKTWRIASSATHGNYLYTSWYGNSSGNHQKVFKSVTGGGTNTIDWEDIGSPIENDWISSIVVDYFNPDHIWVAAGKKVYDVNTLTHTWIDISNGIPTYCDINHLEMLYGSESILFAGTRYGLYYYSEYDGYWQYVDGNLPNVDIRDIQIDRTNNRIVAGTFGRGIWGADLPCIEIHDTTSIVSNQTWTLDKYISGVLIIESGQTLTIYNSKVRLNEDSKIIIHPGGKLILNGGTLTNGCGDIWQGIEVWGNPNATQIPANQGILQVINGGTIENAEVAVRVGSEDYTGKGGGIVYATDANFKNNDVGVWFDPYSYSPSNASYFRYCTFDYDLTITGEVDFTFAKLDGVDYVNFEDCHFTNNSSQNHVGIGIESVNSTPVIEGKCTTYQGNDCTAWEYGLFDNLYYAIYATATNTTDFADVRHTTFTNNFRGIYLSGMTLPRVTSNWFYLNEMAAEESYGLYLDGSTQYWVEDNTFRKCDECERETGIGIYVNASGAQPNEIYLNAFDGVEYAVITLGVNRTQYKSGVGLVIRCNDYNNTLFDETIIYDGINDPPPANEGISKYQGSNTLNAEDMAGNLFYYNTTVSGDYDDLNNESNHFYYYYSNIAGSYHVEPLDYTSSTVTKVPRPIIGWTYEGGCPSNLTTGGGGGTEESRAALNEALADIESTEMVLLALVDGGDTESLNNEVETSTPPETSEIYTELMSESPNLSEAVVETSIDKEEVLPNAMIRDIMVANPHTSTSLQLLAKLDDRTNPMPAWMKAQILAGRSIQSLKTELEGQLASHEMAKYRAMNRLARHFGQQPENPAITDSLIALYQSDNTVSSRYMQAWLYLYRGQFHQGQNVMTTIPANFTLTEDELAEYQNMQWLYATLAGLFESGNRLNELNEAQIGQLNAIVADETGVASVYARNILLAIDELEYLEPVILPNSMKSAEAEGIYNETLKTKAPSILEVYPNPSKDFVIIGYQFDTETEGMIEVRDVSGRLMESVPLKGMNNQLTVTTRTWKAGVYMLSLVVNGKVIETTKFTLVK